jgi:hypothetical protein
MEVTGAGYDDPGGMSFQNNLDGWTGFGNEVVADEWVFVCATIEAAEAPVPGEDSAPAATVTYWNGVQGGTGTIILPADSVEAQMVFGCAENNGTNRWFGMMDEVAIWNRALSPAEITELYNDGAGFNMMSLMGNQWKATNIAPADGIGGVPNDEDVVLQWGVPEIAPPEPITRYDLYFSDDISLVADINDLILPTASVAAGDPLEYNAGLLAPAVYYWRVDAVISDHDPNIAYGKVWSFDTIPAPPTVVSEPVGVMAAAGSTAQYECVADSFTPVTYEWKKEGDASFSREGSVLVLENVSAADEGFYYCEATNAGGTTGSASAGFELPKLLAHYKLDDVVAADDVDAPIADSGPFEHDGIELGDVQSSTGIIDGALLFDGEGDMIHAGTWNPNAVSPELTISLWVKWGGPTGQYQGLIGKRDTWAPDGMMWQIEANNAAGELSFGREGNGTPDIGILPVGQWAHIAVTFDGATARTYLNGLEAASGAFSLGTGFDTQVNIGNAQSDGENPFNGELDDIQFYNYALDSVSVAVLYTSGSGETLCIPGNPAYDFDGDCKVGLSDFAMIASEWMDCNLYPESECQ